MIRNPIVAGKFYPKSADELKSMIKEFVPDKTTQSYAKAMILPHAGYMYSGKVAAQTVAKILAKPRVILLGPNHTGKGQSFALWDKGSWLTPFGPIPIDEPLAKNILANPGPITADYQAHIYEHSLEVELPILQFFWQNFLITPICCQTSSLKNYQQIAQQIYQAVKSIKDEIILIASSDMTHYEPDTVARKKDRLAMESIINLDADQLIKTVKQEDISMCGIAPVAIMIECAKLLNSRKANVVLYQTSGDVTNDLDAVVGYAGIIIN